MGPIPGDAGRRTAGMAVSRILTDQIELFDILRRGKDEHCALFNRLAGNADSGLYFAREAYEDALAAEEANDHAMADVLRKIAKGIELADVENEVPIVTVSRHGLRLMLLPRQNPEKRLQEMIVANSSGAGFGAKR